MSERAPSRDEALEALDFIVNVLKEHEKDLDKLVSELGTVTNQLGDTGEFNGKVKKIEDKINGLQSEVNSLVTSLSRTKRDSALPAVDLVQKVGPAPEAVKAGLPSGLSLLLQCKQWEDFLALAIGAQTVSFSFKESEKTFEVDALKNNHVISFGGELPKLSALLKMYLGKKLQISENQVLEGDMALG